jgi:hypothetical protein
MFDCLAWRRRRWLARRYDELVSNILEEEDDVVACHRQQIEDNMALVQEEMGLLTQVPRMRSSASHH